MGDDQTSRTGQDDPAAEDRCRFEMLLTDLSIRFINMPADRVDAEIVDAQRRVCEALGLDLSVLWQIDPDLPSTLIMTHLYRPLGGPPVPERFLASEYFPWAYAEVMAGRSFTVASMEQISPGAERDAEVWRHFGLKNVATFPLAAGGGATFGAVSFHDVVKERVWTDAVLKQLESVAVVFANAILRKRSEQALRDSEARLVLATDAADAGLWIMRADGQHFWVTAKIRELYGLPPGNDLSLKRLFELIHPEDRADVRTVMDKSLGRSDLSQVEYRIVRPDGSARWMRSCGRQHTRAPGEPAQLMGITTDITERKQAEAASLEIQQELAHAMRLSTMGELAASLAHELNQPLAAILSNAQAARRFLAAPDPDLREIREILDDIVKDDKRAGEVIHHVRAMMQKREVMAAEPLDLNELARNMTKLVHGELVGRNITLSIDLAPALPVVMADGVGLQQVLLNLMVNAMDAMRDQPAERRRLHLQTAFANGRVRVAIRDRGTGIPEQALADIFRPFFTTKAHGLGLGLAISRTMVESHGGKLWAENAPDGGAIFSIEYPLHELGAGGGEKR